MSRAAHDDRVYALVDVPGTGFRDREGTGIAEEAADRVARLEAKLRCARL